MAGPKENRAAIVAEEGWEDWLLELLLVGSPCIPSADERARLNELSCALSPNHMCTQHHAVHLESTRMHCLNWTHTHQLDMQVQLGHCVEAVTMSLTWSPLL